MNCIRSILLMTFMFLSGSVFSQIANAPLFGCAPLPHNYGPFDYRTATVEQKELVEGAHFFANVENLRKGTKHKNRDYIMDPGGEIDYTLRVFPNHPRALLALSKLGDQDRTERPSGAKVSIDCYFQEAIRFTPDDSQVRIIYGIHLAKRKQGARALEQLDEAMKLGVESPNTFYNVGLVYFDLKRYPEALEYAHKAYLGGFPLPGLRDKLKRAGIWTDPVLPAVETAESTPAIEETKRNTEINK